VTNVTDPDREVDEVFAVACIMTGVLAPSMPASWAMTPNPDVCVTVTHDGAEDSFQAALDTPSRVNHPPEEGASHVALVVDTVGVVGCAL